MASNREERFVQRQRGAGIHKIQDIDFGLAFPGGNNVPPRPQRSSRRRTPQPEQTPLIPQRSSRRTPSSNRPLIPRSTTRRTPTTVRNHLPERPSPYDLPRVEDEERWSSSQATRSDSQGSASKKRKITAPASARRLSTIAQNALLETPITRSSEPKAASKSNERMEGAIASGAETLGDLAVAIPDSGHDRGQDNSISTTKSRGKRRSSDPSGAESIKPIPPTKSLRRSSLNVKRPTNQRQRLSASGGGVPDENRDASEARTSGESVPITVHRLSRLHALQYGDDELSFLYGPPPFPKRNGVNAVDVLGQACREIIDKIVEKVDAAAESGRSEATKGEWKIKKKAARTFGTELESRLFDMSEALDNNWALSVRLRQANKEKAALRQELLRIRREREKVALRTDEVRRLHEESTKSSQARNDLNTALHDIELAVERGRTQQRAQTDSNLVEGRIGGGLELRLRTIAAEASSSSSGGGLLSQVKQFNAFLEQTATLLEGGAS